MGEGLVFLLVVVVHLYDKDYAAAHEGDEVGAEHVVVIANESLYHEGEAADSHHDEAR